MSVAHFFVACYVILYCMQKNSMIDVAHLLFPTSV